MTTTTTPLPRYEAWPATEDYPAQVRHTWLDSKGRRCHSFVASCDGDDADNDAAICATALAWYYGGVVDTSRVVPQ